MRVTIIPSDRLVSIDGVAYHGLDLPLLPANVHAVQWYGTAGEVEYIADSDGHKPQNATISDLSEFAAAISVWRVAHEAETTPKELTTEELLKACEAAARLKLEATDWTQLADVAAVLQNKPSFDAYRAVLRAYVLTPVTEPVWPPLPTAVWLE